MNSAVRPTPRRWLHRCALAAGLAALLSQASCNPPPPPDIGALRQLQENGDLEGSLDPLRSYMAANPQDAEAKFLYGRALAGLGRANLATWSLREAMNDPDWLVPAGLQLALASLHSQDFNEVEEIANRILDHDPENHSALLMRANAHAQWKKHPEKALADAKRVLELNPDVLNAYEPMIQALLQLERHDEALEALAEAGRALTERGAGPDMMAWHCSATAGLQQDAGQLEEALATWEECVENHPSDLRVVTGATAFFDVRGDAQRSLEIVRVAYEAAPEIRNHRTALTTRLVQTGRAAEAEAVLRDATGSPNPTVAAQAWLDLAKLRQQLGEFGAAADAIEEALEISRVDDTPLPQLEFDYADTLLAAGRLELALRMGEELPVAAHRMLIRARVLQERRQPARALEEFDEALRLWPDNPFARYYAALAAEELGDFDRAIAEYRYAIRNGPDATDARVRGAALLLAEGKPLKALDLLRSGRSDSPLEIEGQLLFLRIAGTFGNMTAVETRLEQLRNAPPIWAGRGLAEAAEGVALRGGPEAAVRMLESTAIVNYENPAHAAALRAFLRFAHDAGEPEKARARLRAALAAHPDAGVLHEIRGLDLERSGAPADEVRAAYERALELEPTNAKALAGMGRLVRAEDPEEAARFFDRAAAGDRLDPTPRLEAATALQAAGRIDEAKRRLDRLLRAHPYLPEAAMARARIDLDQGVASNATLERAVRAVRFRGGVEALELLARVHEARGEPERAAEASERAQALLEARPASPGRPSEG